MEKRQLRTRRNNRLVNHKISNTHPRKATKKQLRRRRKNASIDYKISNKHQQRNAENNDESRSGLLDLPNEIIQNEIFPYLCATDIDTISRIGSSRLRNIAKENIEVFDVLIVARKCDDGSCASCCTNTCHPSRRVCNDSSELLRICKYNRKDSTFGMKTIVKKALESPKRGLASEFLFGGSISGNLLLVTSGGIFKYELGLNEWNQVASFKSDLNGYVNGCVFRDSLLVISSNDSLSPHVSFLKPHDRQFRLKTSIIDKGIRKCLKGTSLFIEPNEFCYQIFCHTPIPTTLCFCSVTGMDENRILVIGGHPHSNDMKAFIGKLNSRQNDFVWTDVSNDIEKPRVSPIIFKMGDNIYIAGGEAYISPANTMASRCTKLRTCISFNIKEKSWEFCDYTLPYPLSHASVFVSPDDTFAMISGGLKGEPFQQVLQEPYRWERLGKPSNEIILFTKEKGFSIFEATNLIKSRFSHTIIPISYKS